MNKKQIVIIIVVVFIISASIALLNYYISEREFELRNSPEQLKAILVKCGCENKIKTFPEKDELCIGPLTDWQNSTHYIDNNVCKFLEIRDGFVIPIDADHCPNAMIAVDGKCMQPVYNIDSLYWILLITLIPITLIVIFVFKSKTKALKVK
jgi:hypothetical protein